MNELQKLTERSSVTALFQFIPITKRDQYAELIQFIIVLSIGICVLTLTGCKYSALYRSDIIFPDKIGPWTNLYNGNKNLAGIDIEQYPEGSDEYQKLYINKHPAMICYYFWSGKVRQIIYNPDGNIEDDSWWKIDKNAKPESGTNPRSGIWNLVDFNYGSDPHFLHHKDPRKGIKLYTYPKNNQAPPCYIYEKQSS